MFAAAAAEIIVGIALAVLLLVLYSRARVGSSPARPTIATREPPVLQAGTSREESIIVAGREYWIADAGPKDEVLEPCPWCLRVPAPGENITRCQNPHCQRVAHKTCNEKNGGCGGVCTVL